MSGRLESSIEDAINYYASRNGFIHRKLNNQSDDGWPDRLYVSGKGEHFYIEFKRPGEEPRPLQVYRIWTLCKMNCEVYVVDSVEEGKNVIDYYKRGKLDAAPISRAIDTAYDPAIRRGAGSGSRTG